MIVDHCKFSANFNNGDEFEKDKSSVYKISSDMGKLDNSNLTQMLFFLLN